MMAMQRSSLSLVNGSLQPLLLGTLFSSKLLTLATWTFTCWTGLQKWMIAWCSSCKTQEWHLINLPGSGGGGYATWVCHSRASFVKDYHTFWLDVTQTLQSEEGDDDPAFPYGVYM